MWKLIWGEGLLEKCSSITRRPFKVCKVWPSLFQKYENWAVHWITLLLYFSVADFRYARVLEPQNKAARAAEKRIEKLLRWTLCGHTWYNFNGDDPLYMVYGGISFNVVRSGKQNEKKRKMEESFEQSQCWIISALILCSHQ
jgi:hypothetical protein